VTSTPIEQTLSTKYCNKVVCELARCKKNIEQNRSKEKELLERKKKWEKKQNRCVPSHSYIYSVLFAFLKSSIQFNCSIFGNNKKCNDKILQQIQNRIMMKIFPQAYRMHEITFISNFSLLHHTILH